MAEWIVRNSKHTRASTHIHAHVCLYIVGRCGSLVDSSEGSWVRIPLWLPRRDLGQVLRWQLPVALWRETPTRYLCCVGSTSEYEWTWRVTMEI